jgi:hypothetical protein
LKRRFKSDDRKGAKKIRVDNPNLVGVENRDTIVSGVNTNSINNDKPVPKMVSLLKKDAVADGSVSNHLVNVNRQATKPKMVSILNLNAQGNGVNRPAVVSVLNRQVTEPKMISVVNRNSTNGVSQQVNIIPHGLFQSLRLAVVVLWNWGLMNASHVVAVINLSIRHVGVQVYNATVYQECGYVIHVQQRWYRVVQTHNLNQYRVDY